MTAFGGISRQRVERELRNLPELAIMFLPGATGRLLRAAYWRKRLGSMGERCTIGVGVSISQPERVFLGDDVWLDDYVHIAAGRNPKARTKQLPNPEFRGEVGDVHLRGGNHVAAFCMLQGHGGLWVGRDVGIATHTIIYSLSNHYRFDAADDELRVGDHGSVVKVAVHEAARAAYVMGAVVLQDGSGIGPSCVLLPGTTVGNYSWIGPSSVVRGIVPPGVIAGGNPATILKHRFKA